MAVALNNINLKDSSGDFTSLDSIVYPVRSVYMSKDYTTPASIFGGTWSEIYWKGDLGNLGNNSTDIVTDTKFTDIHLSGYCRNGNTVLRAYTTGINLKSFWGDSSTYIGAIDDTYAPQLTSYFMFGWSASGAWLSLKVETDGKVYIYPRYLDSSSIVDIATFDLCASWTRKPSDNNYYAWYRTA